MKEGRFLRPERSKILAHIRAPSPGVVIAALALVFAMTGAAVAGDKLNKDEVTVVTTTGGPVDVVAVGTEVAIPLTNPSFTQKAGEAVLLSATILVTYDPPPGDPAFAPCDLFVIVSDSATSSYYVSDVGLHMTRLAERGDHGDLNDSGAIPAPTSDTLRTLTVTAEKHPNPDHLCDSADNIAQVHEVSVRVSIVTYRN